MQSTVSSQRPWSRGWKRIGTAFLLIAMLLNPLAATKAAPNDAEQQIQQTSDAEKDILRELFNFELDLLTVNQQLSQTKDKIRELEVTRTVAAEALAASERKMADRQELIKKRLRFLYENGRVSYLEVLLQSTNFGDLISRFELIQTVITHDVKLLQETKILRTEISRRAQALVEQQKLLSSEQQNLSQKKEEVTAVIAQKETFLRGLREKRAYYEDAVQQVVDRWNEQIMPEVTKLAFNIGFVASDPDIIRDAETQFNLFPPSISIGISDTVMNKRLWGKEPTLKPFQIIFGEGQVLIQRDLDYELRVSGRFAMDDKKQIVFIVADMTLDGMAISDHLRQTLFRGMIVSFNPTALPMKLQVTDFITTPGKLTVKMR